MKRVLLFSIVTAILFVNVSGATAPTAQDPKATAFDAIDRNKEEIAKVGDAIFSFAELGMQEFETSKLLCPGSERHGIEVEMGISGIPTAIMATYGSGKPVIAIHVEY